MSVARYPVGQEMNVTYPDFKVSLQLHSVTQMSFDIAEGPFAHKETVSIQVLPLTSGIFLVSWVEESGATVTNVQDFDRGVVHSFVTLPGGRFLRMVGSIEVTRPADLPGDDRPERNKALVLEAMTALFQRRDASAVARLYAPDYVQHNPVIPQGRDALQKLVSELTEDVFYEPGMMIAEGDYVTIHGRIRGWAPSPQVVVDIFRVENERLAEHWDVLQNETVLAAGGPAMFDADERARQVVVRT
ncbi:nuclear transport factor 2 family protein [Sphingomonas sp. BK235]|uniref:nuclear transport factor 2 family protein n=1 Tax=Sphingomonas sp. BK235 TaxID=2512131 RepID=UPI0010E622F8|nr:nuclear transport factor 2 family protein [Sphingomonas sp. BK235]TCP30098.1 putative SnoaL-like aldol condensation-catalyzing enzyme [Sphingomonas sp. BK235]